MRCSQISTLIVGLVLGFPGFDRLLVLEILKLFRATNICENITRDHQALAPLKAWLKTLSGSVVLGPSYVAGPSNRLLLQRSGGGGLAFDLQDYLCLLGVLGPF